MNKITIIVLLLIYNVTCAQQVKVTSTQLSEHQIDSVFTDPIKATLQLDYDIHRVYEYNDKAGKHFVVMTKNLVNCEELETCYDSIKAYCYVYKNDTFKLKWKCNDFILPNNYEYSISYWTKYFEIKDYDNDGLADPILVYGTYGLNEFWDGRLKILIYYNNKKSVIRHQNGIHDNERYTQVDSQFYDLPIEIQKRVKIIMENITENDHGIFPYNWENDMKNKQLRFDES
ncbi:M949_RS01915 family surface polysaccharide biosynthesis protein [Formosa sp. PL04]|uniref:M949_RS01915 family surface polysaccharide biosynthesis protein n=1 Tax=Formosa sp. PL04 TaxID=3081755 RepID=UPI002980CAEA|nr:hypothetical protein [Formosa sp. PL04]MDW5288754.1 hypothetical protein [Formosa sp. PL04]